MRSIQLPSDVDQSNPKASFENGVLTVTFGRLTTFVCIYLYLEGMICRLPCGEECFEDRKKIEIKGKLEKTEELSKS